MKRCSKNISPDSLTGMIFAAEGVRHTVVLLNGPMGCKFYHSTTSQFLSIRPVLCLPGEDGKEAPVDYNFLNDWFFRQPRVPCTYLDGYDYVYGTAQKVREGLIYIRDHVDFALIVIINSPGAALIGDQLVGLAREILGDRPYVMLESPGYSQDFMFGQAEAALALLKQLCRKREKDGYWERLDSGKNGGGVGKPDDGEDGDIGEKKNRRKTVNVLGLSIWNRYFAGDRAELGRLLELCGIGANCFLCADCSPEEIQHMPEADLNLVLAPAFMDCAAWLSEQYGTPYYLCPSLPIGFQATERIFGDLCRILGTDPATLMGESGRSRALAWYKIDGIYQMCGLPKGAVFAVEGTAAEVYAYGRFFMEYLGMCPDCLAVTDHPTAMQQAALAQLAADYHAEDSLEKDILDTEAELVFSNANTIAALMATGRGFCGIEISLPGMGYTDIIPKTHMGIQGAMFLAEQVLNGLMSKL